MSAAASGRWRAAQFVDALHQYLPGARQRRNGEARRSFLATPLLFGRQRRRLRGLGRELEARDEMDEFGELQQHLRGIGAAIVLVFENADRRRDVARHRGFEKIDDARLVGDAEH